MNTSNTATIPHKRSVSLAQKVMNELTAKIRDGIYKPGDRLPTEPEVMAEQGVSRTVVREAMSRLQAAGLAETRHGIGTFVLAPPSTNNASTLDLSTVVTIRDVLAMLELRISLETEAAGLAAMRRNDAQLALMKEAIETFEEGVKQGGSSVDADFQFHLQIALATGNKYFEEFYRHLGTTTIPRTRLDTSQFSPEPGQNYLLRTNREHQYIFEAISRGDPQAASAGMRMHLTNSRERLKCASEAAGLKIDERAPQNVGEQSSVAKQ